MRPSPWPAPGSRVSIVAPIASLSDFEGRWGIVVSGPQMRVSEVKGGPEREGFIVATLSQNRNIVRKWVEWFP